MVSADGVPLALSDDIPKAFAEQLAAITRLASLMQGAARIFEAGQPTQALVEMMGGLMLIKSVSDGRACASSPHRNAIPTSSPMIQPLVEAVGEVLSPALRSGAPAAAARSNRATRASPHPRACPVDCGAAIHPQGQR